MNAQFWKIVSGLRLNAERDVLLAKAEGDAQRLAVASARFETLKAALEIYVASHRQAYGRRPWPAEQGPDQGQLAEQA